MADQAALERVSIDPQQLRSYLGHAADAKGGRAQPPAWSDLAGALLRHQKETWEMLRTGYASLNSLQTRQFWFDGYEVRIQFNPGRMTSSAAKVDDRSIRERKCFLCLQNLPDGQRGIPYGDRYMFLCNPFPILPAHFTIPRIDHVPQRIDAEFGVMLDLARDLAPGYSVFYNGPRCGASAPDHLHFQAGTRWSMPVESEYPRLLSERGKFLENAESVRVIAVEGGERLFVSFEGKDPAGLHQTLRRYLAALQQVRPECDEPMVNIMAWYDAGLWTVLVYPRVKHRPSFFFVEGEGKILISPAIVDLGGISVTPLEADFHKVTSQHLVTMYHEVQLSHPEFEASLEVFRSSEI